MRHLIPLLLVFSLSACQPEESSTSTSDSTSSLDQYADTLEASLTATSGAADDANNETIVAQSTPSFWGQLLISDAMAACSRALTNNGSGNCTRDVNCDFGAYLWSGNIQLSFANGSTCGLTGSGDSFTRLVDFARTGRRGTLQTTSNNRVAWDGSTIGGGIEISQTDAMGSVELDVLGQHKILTRTGGRTVFDVSFSTSAPLQMNQLARNGRVISSGSIVIHHNRAKFTAEHEVNNLTYSNSCCYPVSGTVNSNLSGRISGSGSVTFNGCGSFTATLNGQSKNFSLTNCE